MMSRKGRPNNKPKIEYPRKCEQCDYVNNNPSMYHYHNKTHKPILDNTLCDHGCGQLATFRGTGGKYTCEKVSQHCPAYLDKHSKRVINQWANADDRKQKTKESLIQRLHTPEIVERMTQTKRKKTGLLTPNELKEYRHYACRIRQQSQKWAKQQGYVLGQQTFHVDHKLSILDAWHAKLPIEVVNHPSNLQIIEAKKNSSKGSKSSLTVEELLELTGPAVHMNLLCGGPAH